jgi:chorismate mutase
LRLDADKLEALRSWSERLRQAGGEESAAAGRAILMLIEEIDRLQVDLWDARMQLSRAVAPPGIAAKETEAPVPATLHERLQRVLGREAAETEQAPVEAAGSNTEAGGAASPQSWIDSLRHPK